MPFLFRPYRRLLVDAMSEVMAFDNKLELVRHINKDLSLFPDYDHMVTDDTIQVDKYGEGIDKRIGWDTHIVILLIKGKKLVLGFTNKEVE